MPVTAADIGERIALSFGPDWISQSADGFVAGEPGTEVTGIATTFAPSLAVLQQAVAKNVNLIISRENPFWARNKPRGTGNDPVRRGPSLESDQVFQLKRDYIAANRLVIYHLFENWNARPVDAQLVGLAKALDWVEYYKPSGGPDWGFDNGFFDLPATTLRAAALQIKGRLGVRSLRVGGNSELPVRRVGLSHGMYWLDDLQKLLAEPGVDLLVMGEPQWENELAQYSFDLADAGKSHGLILLGQAVSEDPGSGEMAAWLGGFIREVPITWIPTGEPTWMPYS